jgi:lipopolysaccharide biosynthesis glycosyltransferase
VNLLICTNGPYLQHAAVCLRSLLENNADLFFNIVLVGQSGERLDGEKLIASLGRRDRYSLSIKSFKPPQECVLPLNPFALYTLDIWTRLWISDFFGPEVKRALYLDGDIVVVGSIAQLWNADLGGAMLGAVDIPGSLRGVTDLGMRPEDGYFNSGVLLFDLEQWRRDHALEELLSYVSRNLERLRDPDQDALNACFSNRRQRLDYKWNLIRPFYRHPPALALSGSILDEALADERIIHFNGRLKPWSYFSDHPRTSEYWKYLQMTAWRDFVPVDKTPINMVRKRVSKIVPMGVKTRMRTLFSPLFSHK